MKDKAKFISSMLIFGSIGLFVKNISLPPLQIAFFRAFIATIFLFLVWLFKKDINSVKNIKNNILFLSLSGGAIGFNWVLLFKSYKYTTIPNATLSYYFAPIFVIILSPIILKEKFSLKKLICAAAAMLGLFIILLNQVKYTGTYNHPKGILLGLSAALLYSFVIFMNKFMKEISSIDTTLVQILFSCIVLLPFVIKSEINFSSLNNLSILFVIILGLIHTGIAYVLYFSGVKALKTQSIAVLSYIDPISAIIFSALILKEGMNILQIIGGLLILCSVYANEIFFKEASVL